MVARRIAAERQGLDAKAIRAVAHPIRLECLRVFEAEGAMSPAQIARKLGEPVGKVAHHVGVLEDCGCVELIDTRPVRGAVEHFYRPTARPNVTDCISALLPRELREQLADKTLANIADHLERALKAKTVDRRPDRHLSWMQMNLDEKGWKELVAAKAALLEREMEIEAEAAGRFAKGKNEGDCFPVFSSNMGFEMPKDARGDRELDGESLGGPAGSARQG